MQTVTLIQNDNSMRMEKGVCSIKSQNSSGYCAECLSRTGTCALSWEKCWAQQFWGCNSSQLAGCTSKHADSDLLLYSTKQPPTVWENPSANIFWHNMNQSRVYSWQIALKHQQHCYSLQCVHKHAIQEPVEWLIQEEGSQCISESAKPVRSAQHKLADACNLWLDIVPDNQTMQQNISA